MKLINETLNEDFKRGGGDALGNMGIGKKYLIESWLDSIKISDYELDENLEINVLNGTSTWLNFNSTIKNTLPDYIQFNIVAGSFNANECDLISLKGCPRKVTGTFFCSRNYNLRSLEGAPLYIGGSFYCRLNNIPENEKKRYTSIAKIAAEIYW